MSTAASQVRFKDKPVVVVMGVSGSGKTTVGMALAQRLGLSFLDADDYHPKANVAKMAAAISLTDEDRWPWLEALGTAIRDNARAYGGVIATCSALKRIYRTTLSEYIMGPVVYVLLDGSRETLLQRMQARKNHYMPPSLLDSQLATLERPDPDEPSLTVSLEQDVEGILDAILSELKHR